MHPASEQGHPSARQPLQPRIYTVPAGQPFLRTLAAALLSGNLPVPGGPEPGPMQLAATTLLLPTRRAMQTIREAFLKASRGAALLLPRVRTIFAAGEEVDPRAELERLAADEKGALRPAIGEIERQLALSKLVLAWSQAQRAMSASVSDAAPPWAAAGNSAAQARALARELARLMDAMEIEDFDYGRLRSLVPHALAEHWEHTLSFLKIVTEHWPAHLEENGLISRVAHDKALMAAQTASLRHGPPGAPVIVAGVMSSIPVVTELLAAVANLPNGAIVLPGLDQGLDEESWNRIVPGHPEHPQFGLKKMLEALGVQRQQVECLPGAAPSPAQRARARLVSEAMRPAATTQRWHLLLAPGNAQQMADARSGISILEAPSAADEAEAIALILRQVAETPERTAALVSPDRALARRVAARLTSWGLEAEDSSGRPLMETPIGSLLDLAIEAAATRLQPVALICLLKHPLCRMGMGAEQRERGRRTLELAVFRAPYIGRGLADIRAALERARVRARSGKARLPAVRGLGEEDYRLGRELLGSLEAALGPLEALLGSPATVDLQSLVAAHVASIEALGRGGPGERSSLWEGGAGEEASRFLAQLLNRAMPAPKLPGAEYPDFYRGLAGDVLLPDGGPAHPRIRLWEPYESRLQRPDVVIVGALNEGTWPQPADPGPWLSRPMRQQLGMPALEERVGDMAHIFASLLGAERVYLTRAVKLDGVPTLPSRWLLRIRALLEGFGAEAAATPWLAWAKARNRVGPPRPARAPEPRPPVALRPRRLPVTSIEKWIANPYAIFAERILSLRPLPPLGHRPDAALRGQIVHDALGRFTRRFCERLPEDAAGELIACAEAALKELTGSPRVAAFWAPRFARFAAWFAETERSRRAGMAAHLAEIDGAITLEGPAGPFRLSARADRIDGGEGGLIITDYKAGAAIRELASRAVEGLAPQLPLEAAIAAEGGFAGVMAAPLQGLRYISTSGGEPPGLECALEAGEVDLATLARRAREGLIGLIAAFDHSATPYRALRRPRFSYRFDDFAHLARVAEWSAEAAEELGA